MPFTYQIDSERRLIVTHVTGVLSEQVIREIIDVAMRPECLGFDELVDLSQIDRIDYQSSLQVMGITKLAAGIDVKDRRGRFAIVVSSDADFGLSRIYQSYREAQPGANRDVRVFRSQDEALAWIAAR